MATDTMVMDITIGTTDIIILIIAIIQDPTLPIITAEGIPLQITATAR